MKYLVKIKKRYSKKFNKVIPKIRVHLHRKKLISQNISKKTEKRLLKTYSPNPTPYNSNAYLINNQSSPFFDDDGQEEENYLNQPIEICGLDTEIPNLDLFLCKMDSTNDESQIIDDLRENMNKNNEIDLGNDKR